MVRLNPQSPENQQHYDDMMREIEEIDLSALFAVVPGSHLHKHLNQAGNNSSDEG